VSAHCTLPERIRKASQNGDLRDEIDSHSLRPGSDPQLGYHGQYLIADPVLKGLEDTQAIEERRAELSRRCGEIPYGGLPNVRVVTFPWQADWQCNFMIEADETAVHSYELPPDLTGEHNLRVRLLFRTFAPYFLRLLEDQAGLDPEVNRRVPLVVLSEWDSDSVVR